LYELAYLLETDPLVPIPDYPNPMPARVGRGWNDDEYGRIVAEVREGVSWEVIADTHGRTVGAVRRVAANMQPAGATADTLHALLVADQDYDWRGHLARRVTRGTELRVTSDQGATAAQDVTGKAIDLG